MPFKPAWREYQSGDLFYGMAGGGGNWTVGRNIVIKKYVDEGKIVGGDVTTIDEYGLFLNASHPGSAQHGLKHDPDFIRLLQANGKTSGIINEDLNEASRWDVQPVEMGAMAKRKCKTGLEYITRHTPSHIHFCLQNIKLEQVAGKNYTGRQGDLKDTPQGETDWLKKARFITGTELRWVYRNRLDTNVAGKVQFWKNDPPVQCPPPWDDPDQPTTVQQAWAMYKPNHPFTP